MHEYKSENIISREENILLQEIREVQTEEEHIHDFFELVYTFHGSGVHYIDGERYEVGHGDLIFISRGQRHSYVTEGGIRMVNICIAPEFVSRELTSEDSILMLFKHSLSAEFNDVDTPIRQMISFKGEELREADALIKLMLREHGDKSIGYRSVLQGGTRILFAKILRNLTSDIEAATEALNIKIEDVLKYVDENLSKKMSLAELAEKSFYNPVYFGSLIKKYCGTSFNKYIREKRLALASELLKTTSLSIEDIIIKVGYSDRKLFYSHFSDMYGQTPGDFRKNL